MFGPLYYPHFDPVMLQIGPFGIRWYAMAYVTALILGWVLVRGLVRKDPIVATKVQVDDFLTWATLGVIFGGRLGYCLFYQPGYYLPHPIEILKVWHGGMSFHGGALGVIIALILFTRKYQLSFLGFSDRVTTVVPLGLGLGRLANFINGELIGRPAPDWLPWRMIYPNVVSARHPSELYEALLEGFILFTIMMILVHRRYIREHAGFLSGIFLLGYGIARIICEMFREPDDFLGFIFSGITMGQILSIPMLIAGAYFIWQSYRLPKLKGLVVQND
ncbi:prolipoprotein diacylglyceryl transferase [Commensalibacter papalotli (ex Botero et al. 2024)]|uniref:Phosphatidylglycerol--prolipoprotein diacylglyceryl transferase n=1 Tax=Commensalibacter papalotli (ex Botero et al. 2024) TaxID=2972766 RepID=A0ABM9HST0_9PROT|nr:prolipoprotein diacylglyceryl transferase [Commensalibacter papalotli (ex Botero et al. 2024)]CAI3952473.1 Prolipoprotein diacylglyceryltransferase (Lgt) (PDB:5AZB) [Commensalibacter papalotli (ex Botero et al. 2024)]CAI3952975.1 Prolipoprotein diacylglyceryltransferase (Lgt) (PDB:5AZB) [Commensalibacter papalotli (ex Botero et al. 2024)]